MRLIFKGKLIEKVRNMQNTCVLGLGHTSQSYGVRVVKIAYDFQISWTLCYRVYDWLLFWRRNRKIIDGAISPANSLNKQWKTILRDRLIGDILMKKPVAASLAAIPTTRELLVFPEPRMLLSFVSNAGGYFVSLFILFLLLNLHFYS